MPINKKKKSSIKEGLADLAQVAEQDHEVQMARAELYKLAKYSIKLHEMLKNISEQEGLEGWVQSKITKAADYIGSVYHHLDYDVKFQNDVVSEGKCNCNCGKAICESCGKPHKKKKVKEDAKEKFEPHMMYDPKTGESKHAKVEKDHLDMKAKGWSHDKPKVKKVKEDVTSGGTSASSVANVSNPSITRNVKKPKKNKNGTAKNAQDSNSNLMTGQLIKR